MSPTFIVIILAGLTLVFAILGYAAQGSERAFTLFSTLATGAASSLYTFLNLRKKDDKNDAS